VTNLFLAGQVKRLRSFKHFPANDVDAMREVVNTLAKWCMGTRYHLGKPYNEEQQLKLLIDTALETMRYGWQGLPDLRDTFIDLFSVGG
jgi:hypothetical protein